MEEILRTARYGPQGCRVARGNCPRQFFAETVVELIDQLEEIMKSLPNCHDLRSRIPFHPLNLYYSPNPSLTFFAMK